MIACWRWRRSWTTTPATAAPAAAPRRARGRADARMVIELSRAGSRHASGGRRPANVRIWTRCEISQRAWRVLPVYADVPQPTLQDMPTRSTPGPSLQLAVAVGGFIAAVACAAVVGVVLA